MEQGFGKRLMHVLRAVYHMLRRGLCRKRLMMDLHLLLGRGKLAGKALRNLVAAAHHPHPHSLVPAGSRAGASSSADASSSAGALSLFAHKPGDVEFSCTTTPCNAPGAALFGPLFKTRGGRGGGGIDEAEVARFFAMMNAEEAADADAEPPSVALATPSPMLALSLGRSPAGVRQLRITDSPFPMEPEGVDERVDAHADDFIRKFYERLRLQQAYATPDNTAAARRRG